MDTPPSPFSTHRRPNLPPHRLQPTLPPTRARASSIASDDGYDRRSARRSEADALPGLRVTTHGHPHGGGSSIKLDNSCDGDGELLTRVQIVGCECLALL